MGILNLTFKKGGSLSSKLKGRFKSNSNEGLFQKIERKKNEEMISRAEYYERINKEKKIKPKLNIENENIKKRQKAILKYADDNNTDYSKPKPKMRKITNNEILSR